MYLGTHMNTVYFAEVQLSEKGGHLQAFSLSGKGAKLLGTEAEKKNFTLWVGIVHPCESSNKYFAVSQEKAVRLSC